MEVRVVGLVTYQEVNEITPDDQLAIRRAYSGLLGAMVDDTQITTVLTDYAGDRVNVGAR